MDFKRNILITGGAGFIGSHVVRLFVTKYPELCGESGQSGRHRTAAELYFCKSRYL